MAEPAHILVVDDDLASRRLMEEILGEDGHQVVACADGQEAIARLEAERTRDGDGYDAVVSDIRMVEADGLEVLDWVQQHAPETPVLLVTAFGNVDGAVDAIRRGAYDYISKPYDVNAIKLVVDRALRHRRLAAENRRLKRELANHQEEAEKRPDAILYQPIIGQGRDAGKVIFSWKAAGSTLAEQPVSLYYAKEKDGNWVLIASGLPKEGTFPWRKPLDIPANVFLRTTGQNPSGPR